MYWASQGDEVDVHCAQYFVDSSLAPVVLFRRRLKSVADVLKGIRNNGFTQSRSGALLSIGSLCVVMVLVVLSPPWISGIGGFLQTCTASKGAFLIPLRC